MMLNVKCFTDPQGLEKMGVFTHITPIYRFDILDSSCLWW